MTETTDKIWTDAIHDAMDDILDDDSPYCQCDLDPIEDEEASNCCSCCGKPLA